MVRILDLRYKVAFSELELRRCTSRTRLALQSYNFRAGAAQVYFYKVVLSQLELHKCTPRTYTCPTKL